MKYMLTTRVFFLFLWLATTPVFAQGADHEWDILNRQVKELYRTGQYDRAVVVAKKALEVAEHNVGPNHLDVAKCLNNLAVLYEAQGRYEQAKPLIKRSLVIYETALGPDHPDVALTLNTLAAIHNSQGEYALAERLSKRWSGKSAWSWS